jgi:predicted dehydrogenase
MANVRWGLIGATVIGREWMIAAIGEAAGNIVVVMSTDSARGRAYAHESRIPKAVGSLPELFASGVEAVYVSTTNERHRAETIAAAEAGAHVLCEKPLARASATPTPWLACAVAPASCWRPTTTCATVPSRMRCGKQSTPAAAAGRS